MLYKVTPNLTPQPEPKKDPNAPKAPRKRRKSAIFDGDGHEVLITMMCLKCKAMKPLLMFGLRKMADGAVRNQPWCRSCRSGASSKKKPEAAPLPEVAPVGVLSVLAGPAVAAPELEVSSEPDLADDEVDTALTAMPLESSPAH